MLKPYILIFTALLFTSVCFAQEIEVKNKIGNNVTENFKVLASDKSVKNGLYQAIYNKKTVVATGLFENNKQTGVWRFYDRNGQALEIYDYTKKQLLFEAPEDTTSSLRYFVDKEIKPTDQITKPVKIGGRFYGFLPYLNLFKLPTQLVNYNPDLLNPRIELLISPLGRLSSYRVYFTILGSEKFVNMNLKLPNPDDLVFIPATYNGEAISSRIVIQCELSNSGHLEF